MKSDQKRAYTVNHLSKLYCVSEIKIEYVFYLLNKQKIINIYKYGREIYAKCKRFKKTNKN